MKTEDILCLVENATTHTILKDRKKFHTLTEKRGSVTIIANDNVTPQNRGVSLTIRQPAEYHCLIPKDPYKSKMTILAHTSILTKNLTNYITIIQESYYITLYTNIY